MATCWASCLATLPAYPSLDSRVACATATSQLNCSFSAADHQAAPLRHAGLATTRRQLAGHLLLSLLAVPTLPALAADESPGIMLLIRLVQFFDVSLYFYLDVVRENLSPESVEEYNQYSADDDKYSLLVPARWIQGTGKTTGERNVTAFFPADDTSVNVNVLITSVGADFTALGSFGTIDAFAETMVNGMDRSWKKPPGQAARLVNSKSKNGMYYVEYTVQQPGEKKRHLLSVIGMRFNGWYNRLYTVTGQYWEDDKAKYGPLLEKVVESFKFA